jgi:hypothetical protein
MFCANVLPLFCFTSRPSFMAFLWFLHKITIIGRAMKGVIIANVPKPHGQPLVRRKD